MNPLTAPPGRAVRPAALLLVLALTSTALAACSGGGDDAASGGGHASDGTFTLALATDPGNLDPHASATSSVLGMSRLAYDTIVAVDPESTEVVPSLAAEWSVDGTTATFTLRDDVTCADGSAFTAETAAANIEHVADPANESPYLGAFLPAGVTASADGDTLTLELAGPAPFLLEGLSSLAMVCDSGLADRDTLAAGTAGTGPFVLDEAVPDDHYTYSVREGYTWGPDGATTTEPGTPATVNVRIVANETTSANLLLSGEVNAVQVIGPDTERLEAAGLYSAESAGLLGEQWYNHAEGHVTADPAVRAALAQALDLTELRQVLTSGKGSPPTTLATVSPAACTGDSITAALPEHDPAAAATTLDDAGWTLGDDGVRAKDGKPLTIAFLHDTALGTGGASAAELATAAWTDLGVDVDVTGKNTTELSEILFGTGAWDVAWEPINVSSPDQLVGFLSGPSVADGGTNFAAIDNADYAAAVGEATTMQGAEGCDTWLAGETALVEATDVTPFANSLVKIYGNGAEFLSTGSIVPTSIRVLS
ncbi:peptide/nickel transport system substrate-binding protein [Promicromonospora umidemergens]|uniref:ABC transporter substrate-binding protein n=1 Tax=Promicromonospora umidemergens TaxID=629679 RepID=A0ABP8XF47_9MICO|nr:ABC transporter substrate-binding protein [Promicromonospora umidemergens]MCP2283095.1 peptide/nickel transport system substrate-binding protein [Promicromonospora umidemergens]